MSLNKQVPFLYTLAGAGSEVLTISNAKGISILAMGGTVDVLNANGQTMPIPDGSTVDMNADSGNTLSDVIVTPSGAATAYVTMLGGLGIVTP